MSSLPHDLLPLLGAPALVRATHALWSAQRGNVALWKHVENPPAELFVHCPALEYHRPRPHAFAAAGAHLIAKGRFVVDTYLGRLVNVRTGEWRPIDDHIRVYMSDDASILMIWDHGGLKITRPQSTTRIGIGHKCTAAALFGNGAAVYATSDGVYTEQSELLYRGDAGAIGAAGATLLISPGEEGGFRLMQQNSRDVVSVPCPQKLRFVLSPNGLRAVAYCADSRVRVFDAVTGAELWTMQDVNQLNGAFGICISNAEHVVFCRESTTHLVTRGAVRLFMDIRGYDPCFDDDGRLWFYSKGRVHSLLL